MSAVTIKIQKPVKVGDYILEKGDVIRVYPRIDEEEKDDEDDEKDVEEEEEDDEEDKKKESVRKFARRFR